ncbi:MAG TPA: ankyrin repeat domain-containing protein [bacterium]|nr:ankyrin repeat domain-containing protein [bacterium]
MTRCKVCGELVKNGSYCSADCERKWDEINRDLEGELEENPFASDGGVEAVEKVEGLSDEVPTESEDQPLELTQDLMVEEHEQTGEPSEIIDLITAAKNNSVQSVLQYLGEGANVNQKSAGGWTALQEAAKEGRLTIVKVLIENGANVNLKNERGWTALHRAANYGHLEVVRYLIESNADVNSKNIEGMCPVVFALKNKHLEVAILLIEKGTDPNCSTDLHGRTMLFHSLRNNWTDLAEILIKNGAASNVTEGDESALVFALKNCQMNIAKLLVEHGADPKTKDKNGISALNIAIRNNFRETALLLVEKGADVKVYDDRKNTPLHLAAASNDLELVKMIVKKKPNLVAVNKEGHYPLHNTTDKEISAFLKRKMFPDKALYSLRIFGLVLLLTSIALPFFISFVFSGLALIATLIFTDWPSRESYRVYLLETLAVYLVITSAMGVHPNSFDYPFVFLIIPVGVFFLFNFILRPAALFATTINKDGSRPKFMSFCREHIGNQMSFSPITILRPLNVIAIFAIFLLYGFFNYDHLKKNDEYILSYAIKLIPEKQRSAFVYQENEDAKKVTMPENIEYKQNFSGQKDLDAAISQYLSKNFNGAIASLHTAMQDRSISEKANQMRLEIQVFSRLWDRAKKTGSSVDKRRDAIIDRMIQYDKKISGGLLEAEILMMR